MLSYILLYQNSTNSKKLPNKIVYEKPIDFTIKNNRCMQLPILLVAKHLIFLDSYVASYYNIQNKTLVDLAVQGQSTKGLSTNNSYHIADLLYQAANLPVFFPLKCLWAVICHSLNHLSLCYVVCCHKYVSLLFSSYLPRQIFH